MVVYPLRPALPAPPQVLTGLGMLPSAPALAPPPPPDYLAVQLDGRVVGHVRSGGPAAALVARLRAIKAAALQVGTGVEVHAVVQMHAGWIQRDEGLARQGWHETRCQRGYNASYGLGCARRGGCTGASCGVHCYWCGAVAAQSMCERCSCFDVLPDGLRPL